ncbi:hypothetical protein ACFFWC_01880 [Plantactinospora siamensis]|uniref:Uncharacterized protein n=1 Tax=Plantactinospora siamensis TaxID=555372 RepID=A0ABV6NV16_9ACTN
MTEASREPPPVRAVGDAQAAVVVVGTYLVGLALSVAACRRRRDIL